MYKQDNMGSVLPSVLTMEVLYGLDSRRPVSSSLLNRFQRGSAYL